MAGCRPGRAGWTFHGSPGLIDDPGQLAVGGPGGFQFVCAFVELDFQVEDLLFEVEDAGLEAVDVGRRADPRSLPDLLAQFGAEAVLQYPDLVCQPPAAVVRGEEVGLQRGPAGRRGGPGRGLRRRDMDLGQQVWVPVEEGAVDSGPLGERGDGDGLGVPGHLGQGVEDAFPAASGVGLASFGHPCCGGCVGGHAGRSGRTSGRGWRTRGMPRNAWRVLRTAVTASWISACSWGVSD
jgi:hypothetical protein